MIPHLSLPDEVRLTLKRRILNNEVSSGERLVETSLAAEFGGIQDDASFRASGTQERGLGGDHAPAGLLCRPHVAGRHRGRLFRPLSPRGGSHLRVPRPKIDESLLSAVEKELDEMQAAAEVGDVAAIVEVDTRLHGLIVEAGGRPGCRTCGIPRRADGLADALFLGPPAHRPPRGGGQAPMLLDALGTRRPRVIERAIKDHYVAPRPQAGKDGVKGSRSGSPDCRVGAGLARSPSNHDPSGSCARGCSSRLSTPWRTRASSLKLQGG